MLSRGDERVDIMEQSRRLYNRRLAWGTSASATSGGDV
jgi:hypothetical protein